MNRRHLLTKIVQGFSLTGLAFLSYPFVKFLFSGADEDLSLELSLADLIPGETMNVLWRGRNLMIVRRSDAMVRNLASSSLELKDPASASSVQPDFAVNEYRSIRPDILVTYTNCTHLGCEVAWGEKERIGFHCPCHESEYDLAGRVLEGGAAPYNLEIPNYRFVSGNRLQLIAE